MKGFGFRVEELGIGVDGSPCRVEKTTQGPSWGYFKSQFLTGLSSFGDCSPQNGSKTIPKSQNRPLGYPHIGPFVVTLNIGWWMLRLAYCTFFFSSCSPCRAEGAVLKRVEGSGRRDWMGVRVQGPPQTASLTLPARGVRAEGLGLRVHDP